MSDLRTRIIFSAEGTQRTVGDILKSQKALQEAKEAAAVLGDALGLTAAEATALAANLDPKQVKQFAAALNEAKTTAQAQGKELEDLVDVLDQLDDAYRNLIGPANDASEAVNLDLGNQLAGGNAALAQFAAQAAQQLQQIAQQAIQTGIQFENLRTQLGTALGGDVAAEQAFANIQSFAATTPFQVDEITDSFVRLANRGVEPTNTQLGRVGDLASALQKPFSQVTEAILDVNNTERWRELGIEVQTTGNKITGTFKGTTIEAERSVEGALKLVDAFGQLDGVAGGMARQSENLGGAFSNLEDAQAALADGFTTTVGPAVEVVTRGLTSLIGSFLELPKPVQAVVFGLTGLAVAAGAALLALTAFEAANGRVVIAQVANTLATAKQTIAATAVTAATLAQAVATNTLTGAQQAQLAGLGALTAKTLLLGAAIGAIALVVNTYSSVTKGARDIEEATANVDKALQRLNETRAAARTGAEQQVAVSELEAAAFRRIQEKIGPLGRALDVLRNGLNQFNLNGLLTNLKNLLPFPDELKNKIQGLIDLLPKWSTEAETALKLQGVAFDGLIAKNEQVLLAQDKLRSQGFKATKEELQDQKVAIDSAISALESAETATQQDLNAKNNQLKVLRAAQSELQRYAGAVIDAAQAQQAIADETEQANSRIALAERRRLNEVQVLLNQGTLDEQEAARQKLKANQDRIQAELAAEEEKIRKLQALQPGTQRDNAIVAAENKAAQLRGQLLDAEVRQRQQALSEIAQATQEANQRATLAEQERLNQVTRLLNQQVITEQQAAEQRLAITTARIQSEIKQEQQRLALLRQQPESDARDQAELASRQRLAQLTAQLLDAEANKQRQLREQVIAGIERQQQAEQVRHNAQVQNLERERAGIDALIRTQERLNQLADAQAALAASRSNLAQTFGQIEVDQLNRALEIRRKIDDPNTDSGVRQILEQQLRQLAGQASGEAQIIARKAEAEQRLAAQRRDTLLQEQAQQRRALESEIERNRLAAQRLEIEARISALAAARAESDARATAAKVRQDPNATAEDRALADQAVGAATQNRQLADQAAKDAAAVLAQQNQLADASRQRLSADQEAARAQFNAAEQARVQAEQLAIAEARAKGLADQLGRGQQAQQGSGPILRQDGMVDHDATHAAAVQRNMANALAASMPAIPTPAQLNPQLAPAATAQSTELTAIRNQLAPLEELVRSIAASSAATANRPAQLITLVQDALDRGNPSAAAEIRRRAGL
jgi:hypothetical protein